MAQWSKCQLYTEYRDPIWVNLDHVATIRGFEKGSVLTFAVPDGDGQMERTVWNKPEELLKLIRDA